MTQLEELRSLLASNADPVYEKQALWFFKTGPGQYGEGDKFYGIRVPHLRLLVRPYDTLSLKDCAVLLKSPVHEERMAALFILRLRYQKKKTPDEERERIYDFYMKSTKYINNWDLVDLTAPYISGDWLFTRERSILFDFARSNDLWKKRIAMITTQGFLRRGDFDTTFAIADILLHDTHDLIHKAVGWMLREIGKRDPRAEEDFLKTRYTEMPRTMLRYAIEKFPESKRQKYLKGKV